MKRLFYFVAIAASVMLVASCGNNNSKKAEKSGEEAQAEAPAEPVAEEPSYVTGPCTVECELFSVDVPEGWKILSQDNHSIKIGTGTDAFSDEQIRLEDHTYQNYDDALNNLKRLNGKDLGKQKYGANTWQAFDELPDYVAIIKAISKHDSYVEYVQVNCNKKAEDSGVYKDIMASINLK